MPYWYRREALDTSLAAYRALYPHLDLEFSVADDGTYPPLEVDGCIVTRLPEKPIALNPCVPLNAAVRASTGDIIVLTNPEILHTTNVLDAMLAELTGDKDYVAASCWDDKLGWLAGPKTRYDTKGRWPVPPGAHFHFCAMMHRSFFEAVGGFDEMYRMAPYGDDSDFLWALFVAGATFKTVDIPVLHTISDRTLWVGDQQTNFQLFWDKWNHLPEFIWSDSAHKMRMQLGWVGGLADGTVCGSGSTLAATQTARQWLPQICKNYGIHRLADAGAGDLHWARMLFANSIYLPFDLVPRHPDVTELDISKESLPRVDAILCRHVLIHMDPSRVKKTLDLFKQSARYLIASHYPESDNTFDPGKYYNQTNLAIAPYALGEPLEVIADTNEADCQLALWDLQSC